MPGNLIVYLYLRLRVNALEEELKKQGNSTSFTVMTALDTPSGCGAPLIHLNLNWRHVQPTRLPV